MKYAPIYIITLCRDEHFKRCIESLKRNTWAQYTDVYIGLDYPPSDKYREGWERICKYLNEEDFTVFHSFTVIRRTENLGAVANSKDLYKLMKSKYDRYIYSEDDLEYAPTFLEYINKTMWKYEDDMDVIGVTGYCYPVNWEYSEGATCIKQNFNVSMWGTAFWIDLKEVANEYITQGKHYESLSKVMSQKLYRNMIDFSQREYFPKALKYYPGIDPERMMMRPTDGAMRLYTAIEGKYIIMPTVNKVRNHGFDGTGLYCQMENPETGRFVNQKIDDSSSYECVPNTLDNIRENRNRLNAYEKVSLKQIWVNRVCKAIITLFGVKFSRFLVRALKK